MASEARRRLALMEKVQFGGFGANAFLDVVGVSSSAWYQQGFIDGSAVAFGLAQPAYRGIFGPLDPVMYGLTNMAVYHTKAPRKEIARLVCKNWKPLTRAFAYAERGHFIEPGNVRVPELPRDRQQFLAVGMTTDEETLEEQIEFGIGQMLDALGQVNKPGVAMVILDLQHVVRTAYMRAEKADVAFPARLCPDPDDAEAWQAWMAAIDEYLAVAGARKRKATAKASAREWV